MTAGSRASAEARPRRFRSYSEHRGFGVEWLGETPAHWEVKRLTDLATLVNGFPFDSKLFDRRHGTPLVRIRDLFNATTEVNWAGDPVPVAAIGDGDILIGMDGDFSIAWWDRGSALLNQRLCCVRAASARVSQRYLFYCLRFPLRALNDVTHSTTVRHLSSFDVLKFRLPFPPLAEQQAIADFLDRETAKIDALVTKKERLIELLQEKRTALITRAVTRGLNPNVPMKDSGVQWLGEIPAHWELARWRYCCRITAGQITPEDEHFREMILIAPNHVESGTGRLLYTQSAAEQGAISGKYLVAPGNIIYSKIRPALNKLCVATGSWLCSADMYPVSITDSRLRTRFLVYFMLSERFVRLMVDESMRVAMPKVNRDTLADCAILVPPRAEQLAIVTFLDHETGKIDALTAKAHKAIDHLNELRTALISAAVTGKIDVREAASQ